jgi:hypothetical protein
MAQSTSPRAKLSLPIDIDPRFQMGGDPIEVDDSLEDVEHAFELELYAGNSMLVFLSFHSLILDGTAGLTSYAEQSRAIC